MRNQNAKEIKSFNIYLIICNNFEYKKKRRNKNSLHFISFFKRYTCYKCKWTVRGQVFWLKFILCCSNKKNIFLNVKNIGHFDRSEFNSSRFSVRFVRIVKKWQMILVGIEILWKVLFTHKYTYKYNRHTPFQSSIHIENLPFKKSNRLESNFYFRTIYPKAICTVP